MSADPQFLHEPLRQSTVETVDSGIADDHNGGGSSPSHMVVSNSPRLSLDSRMIPIRPQARFINGHRVVTRSVSPEVAASLFHVTPMTSRV